MKVDGKQKNRPGTGKTEGILAGWNCHKNRKLYFVNMKSFLKTKSFNNQPLKSEFLEVAFII
ncbi:MAG TPA: hypothetical protein DET40_10810 [Lentisphaeria bacterium]|nr:hypothetical protein [Lentisphaeria bacterium]